MDKHYRVLLGALVLGNFLSLAPTIYAATPIDLAHQNRAALQTFFSSAAPNTIQFDETNRSVDFNKTLHVRIQQTYLGYPVFGADAVMHIPYGNRSVKNLLPLLSVSKKNPITMNGIVYQNLYSDLDKAISPLLTQAQLDKALQQAIELYQEKIGTPINVKDQHIDLIVYIDDRNKAHWAYKITFLAP